MSCATIISSGDLTTSGINSSNIVSSGTIHCFDLSCANVISSGNLDCLDLSCANVVGSGNIHCLDLSCVDISASGDLDCLDLNCVDISASGNITCVNFDSTNIVSSSLTNSIIKYEQTVVSDGTATDGTSTQIFPNSFYSISTTNTGIIFDLQAIVNDNIGKIIYIHNNGNTNSFQITISSGNNVTVDTGKVRSFICVAASTWIHING